MFISNENYIDSIVSILGDRNGVDIAVAFLGGGAEELLAHCQGGRLVCNLESGATNPKTVRRIIGQGRLQIRTHTTLHAKLFIGKEALICGSANLSTNGLGIENAGTAFWKEAGLLTRSSADVEAARNWFSQVWDSANAISEMMLAEAEEKWRKRTPMVGRNSNGADSIVHGPSTTSDPQEDELNSYLKMNFPDQYKLYFSLRTAIQRQFPGVRAERESGGKGWIKFRILSPTERRVYARFGLVLQSRENRLEVWFKNNQVVPSAAEIRAKGLEEELGRKKGKAFFIRRPEEIDIDVIRWIVNAI